MSRLVSFRLPVQDPPGPPRLCIQVARPGRPPPQWRRLRLPRPPRARFRDGPASPRQASQHSPLRRRLASRVRPLGSLVAGWGRGWGSAGGASKSGPKGAEEPTWRNLDGHWRVGHHPGVLRDSSSAPPLARKLAWKGRSIPRSLTRPSWGL